MTDNAIRPFRVNAWEAELTELRRRINATKWPERERSRRGHRGRIPRRATFGTRSRMRGGPSSTEFFMGV